MEAEIIIVALSSFVGGGAMGAAGMLLCQWVVRKMSPPPQQRLDLMDPRDLEVMKADVADLAVRLHSVDARLDFTEQLLGGALSGARPPESLPPTQAPPPERTVGSDAEASSVGPDAEASSVGPDAEASSVGPNAEASPDGEDTSPDGPSDPPEGVEAAGA